MAGVNYPHYRSQFGDTTFTKVFVGGLAWETPNDELRKYFEPFGDILEAVIILDKISGKSKGYGFVTFRDPESAKRACADPNPVIDGRRANCNIASLGRPRPSPPRVRNQVGNTGSYQGGVSTYGGVAPPLPASQTPVMYPPFGYTAYVPEYSYQQAMYNPQVHQQAQYYNQMYGGRTSGSPFYYGYQFQGPNPRTTTIQPQQNYIYYPNSQMQMQMQLPIAGSTSFQPFTPSTTTTLPSSTTTTPPTTNDSPTPQRTSTETEAGVSQS